MSKIKNGGLDQYGAKPFKQQQFGTAGIIKEMMMMMMMMMKGLRRLRCLLSMRLKTQHFYFRPMEYLTNENWPAGKTLASFLQSIIKST